MPTIGLQRALTSTFDKAAEALPAALEQEGFGVLTHIDVSGVLAKKLGVDFRRYAIFGACNPHFAHRALQLELSIGVLLPCNVVLYENDDGTATVIAVDPMQTFAAGADDPTNTFDEIAGEVKARLQRVVDSL